METTAPRTGDNPRTIMNHHKKKRGNPNHDQTTDIGKEEMKHAFTEAPIKAKQPDAKNGKQKAAPIGLSLRKKKRERGR